MDKNRKHISIVKYLPIIHAPYIPEMDFYMAIRSGDIRKVKRLCREPFHEKKGLGVLSDNNLQNMKYHFCISAALIARVCIEGGLPLSVSYGMSDYYIKAADASRDIMEISELHDEMAVAYASRMRKLYKEQIFSRPVTECIEYILEHLDTRIKMEDLSKYTGLTSSYLSRLFKKETRQTVTDYILDRKLETSCNMLVYSTYPVNRIADTLAFPSAGYYCRVFKERYNMTPSQYRKQGPSTFRMR